MDQDYKSLESKIADVAKTVVAVNAVVYVVNILIDSRVQISRSDLKKEIFKGRVIEAFNSSYITPTEAATCLSQLGASDAEVTETLRQTDQVHEPSGIPYSSDRIKWATEKTKTPFWPSAHKITRAGWKHLTDSATFSKEAQENFGLEGEVDSPSKIYASELSDSPPTSPFGERGGERYQYVGPVNTFSEPAGFGGSIFGRGVIIFAVVAVIGVIVKKFVFKRKETVVDKKQDNVPEKEREEAPP